MRRLSLVKARLQGRMDVLPDDDALRRRLEELDTETLGVLVGSGMWETLGSGGEEVDVTRLFTTSANDSSPMVDPDLPWMAAALQQGGRRTASA